MQDRLVDGSATPGYVILNHGDPAYRRHPGDDPPTLSPAEAIFLRIVAYLAFVDGLYVPARYILQGDAMWRAVQFAEPLLRSGLVTPERRAEASSCEDLAARLGLGGSGRDRGRWLDERVAKMRTFRSTQLGAEYHELLLDDLQDDGPFLRSLRGRARRGAVDAIKRAHDAFGGVVGDYTPEVFSLTVGQHLPSARQAALQWAMARYYLTPTLFDNMNTREIPRSAANLLVRGGALDADLRPMETAAPVEAMYKLLTLSIPKEHHVGVMADAYCEAITEVREKLPHARRVFREVRERAELGGMASELGAMMAAELRHQQGLRPRAASVVYTLGTSLATGVGGVLLGADVAIAVGSSVATGAATQAGHALLADRISRRRRPWPLAIDYLSETTLG